MTDLDRIKNPTTRRILAAELDGPAWRDPKYLVPGGSFALDVPATPPRLWGDEDYHLWAHNEALLNVGPVGIGKTTLTQRLALARHGLTEPKLLELPVEVDELAGLYLAMDRPDQIARSLGRMVSEPDRSRLDERLLVWRGRLPFNVAADPEALANMAADLGAGTVYVDSLKNLGAPLAGEEGGQAVEAMLQALTLAGVQVVANHHQRKGGQAKDSPKPKSLDDVYGSVWITSAAGSVLLLWGRPGDIVLDFSQLKLPAGEGVTGWRITHDPDTGTLTRHRTPDALDIVRDAPGITTAAVARALSGTDDPSQTERARRKLAKLESRNRVHSKPGPKPAPTRWFPVDWNERESNHAPNHAPDAGGGNHA